ncbi:MAG: dicarboxylate/amino acid:cation symporter [Bacteroidales bacterium]|nr:dicarboxylate/amino acid:cation symporter [Bacteroidales bacterium]MCF8391734.1 dicarboxylate/amino acid:cation symporter [Bacteroidales bacterium]
MKKLALWILILIGMALGVLWGLISVHFGWEKFTVMWVKPWGTMFLNLLKLIAVPLIFVSLVKGISSLKDISRLSRIGLKTIGLYVATTVFAITVGLILVNSIKPGNVFPEEKQQEYKERFGADILERELEARKVKEQSPLQFIVDIIPENIVNAASNNANMLQIIFFAILFAVAMIMLPESKTETVAGFFDGLNDIILKIIDIIMKTAPYGVFALMAGLIVDFSGDKDIFTALGLYMFTVILALLLLIIVFYPLLNIIFTKINVKKFYKGMLPTQLVAFSTSSSAATLPVTMKQCTEEFGVSKGVANFVLPVGVTINMDGTSAYIAIAAVFIAQVFGISLGLGDQLVIVLMVLMASIGAPGIPGGSIVMLIIVLNTLGLPEAGLALILGVDRPLDMLRTAVNVTGDSTVSAMVAKSEGELDIEGIIEK